MSGRPPCLTSEQVEAMRLSWSDRTGRQWAKYFNVSHVSIYNYAHRLGLPLQVKKIPRPAWRPKPKRKLGRPLKVTEAMIAEMRAGWFIHTTNHWAHKFNVSPSVIYSAAKAHHFPPRPKGLPKMATMPALKVVPVKGPKPQRWRCPECCALYLDGDHCPNGHQRAGVA